VGTAPAAPLVHRASACAVFPAMRRAREHFHTRRAAPRVPGSASMPPPGQPSRGGSRPPRSRSAPAPPGAASRGSARIASPTRCTLLPSEGSSVAFAGRHGPGRASGAPPGDRWAGETRQASACTERASPSTKTKREACRRTLWRPPPPPRACRHATQTCSSHVRQTCIAVRTARDLAVDRGTACSYAFEAAGPRPGSNSS
jgi:hypothetical protein